MFTAQVISIEKSTVSLFLSLQLQLMPHQGTLNFQYRNFPSPYHLKKAEHSPIGILIYYLLLTWNLIQNLKTDAK